MSRAVTPASQTAVPDLDRVVDLASDALGIDETQALGVVDEAVNAVEHLLAEHRLLVADELLTEADRFTRGAFADGIRHAAAAVLDPPAVIQAVETAPTPAGMVVGASA